jgi:penicillin amidase
MKQFFAVLVCCAATAVGAPLKPVVERVAGVQQRVEVLRDRWGVPHIYARNTDDLFFAQGWITAKDRLYQLDRWRRTGSGKWAEVSGPSALAKDRMARLVNFRGDWNTEWQSYHPEAKRIATAFVNGINAYIRSLEGKRPPEFEAAGYDPGLWEPEDVASRMAGLVMTRNLTYELTRALDTQRVGTEVLERNAPPDPFIKLEPPRGLDLKVITLDLLRQYQEVTGNRSGDSEWEGSNNWVVDGSMTATGKPLLANDPHRPIQLPSLRKTVHLVAPGWNAIGAGEPALPGIALGHNEQVGFGFTIVGIDQQDLFVERLNPANANEYKYLGQWRKMDVVKETIAVRGQSPANVELKYTVHGPVIAEDRSRGVAFALKWTGAEPGGAGYLAALRLMQARNWKEFLAGVAQYKVPSENLVYADMQGNIGWIASGLTPVRKNGHGLYPVPGDTGEYEWSGYLGIEDHPQKFNPSEKFIATANHKILPPGFGKELSYEWAPPYRFQRAEELLKSGKKFTVADFQAIQQDIVSIPARRFIKVIQNYVPPRHRELVDEIKAWDARLTAESRAALVFEFWFTALFSYFGQRDGKAPAVEVMLQRLEKGGATYAALTDTLDVTVRELTRRVPDRANWKWGTVHLLSLRHPTGRAEWSLPNQPRPGDGYTVNAAGGSDFRQSSGPSYRHILDLSNWDNSVMTNVPGESGDPRSAHFRDLFADWQAGRYHPMPFTRKAVEAAAEEKLFLEPATKGKK